MQGFNLYRPAHAQLVGRKRRADDDSLLIPNAEAPDIAGRIPWDGPHKRILFESEVPDSTSSGSGTQEARPGWPPDSVYPDSTQYGESRYLRANRSATPVGTPNRPRFTSTPVPRYAGGSNWDQYCDVFRGDSVFKWMG